MKRVVVNTHQGGARTETSHNKMLPSALTGGLFLYSNV